MPGNSLRNFDNPDSVLSAFRLDIEGLSMLDFRSFTPSRLEALMQEMGQPAYRARQLFRWLWRPGVRDFSGMMNLPADLRRRLAKIGAMVSLAPHEIQRSADGTVKYAWTLRDGMIIETVLIPERDHNTICISTQVGCAMGCRFCHTGRMGFRRNLRPSEIAGQVLSVVENLGDRRHVRNLVFMGMGEPLANYRGLTTALSILTDELGLNFSQRRITVSTCGLVPEILRLGHEWDVGLAISLHAPDDEARNRLMPVNKRYPLAELMNACRRYPLSKRRRITFEYLLMAGENDRPEHAVRLAELLRGIPSKINLIPFNPSSGLPFNRPGDAEIQAFQRILTDAGYTAMIRKSKGQDIAAACGQLGGSSV